MTSEIELEVDVYEVSNGEVVVQLDKSVSADCPEGHVGCAFQKAYARYVRGEDPDNECIVE